MSVTGVIGVSGGDLARYAIFYHSLLGLQTPKGTAVIPARGANIAENRNGIAAEALRLGAEWVLYLDDDQVLAPDTLLRLLACGDLDVISGLYVSREPPFIPHVYDTENADGWCMPRLLSQGDRGVHQVLATGAGCMLVRARVLRAVEAPLWRLGQITKDGWGDDLHFCHRVREAGFKIHVDLDTVVGHHMNAVLWPQRTPTGDWVTSLVHGSTVISTWPATAPAQIREEEGVLNG